MSENTQGCSGDGRAISDLLRMLLALEKAYTARRVQIGSLERYPACSLLRAAQSFQAVAEMLQCI
jgi:hypothetical protein